MLEVPDYVSPAPKPSNPQPTGPIYVTNEWDPLEEIIVGRADNFVFPQRDGAMDVLVSHERQKIHDQRGLDVSVYDHDDRLIEETEEDLELLCDALREIDITVRRPDPTPFDNAIVTPHWSSDHYFPYCPRDILFAYGNMIVETPSVFRSRYFETFRYKDILLDYMKGGSKWISAPKPSMKDAHFIPPSAGLLAITNDEPMFDAANILRANHELFYLVSDSGNALGLQWLRTVLGDAVTIHRLEGFYTSIHIDSTIALLGPRLALVNPSRINADNMPESLHDWEILYAPEMACYRYSDAAPISSEWLGMNLLMVNPSLAIVDSHQRALIRLLEGRGIDVLPLKLRHGRHLGGGFHCVTLDVRRRHV